MSLSYIFTSGKYKGKQIRWVKKNDFKYLKDINNKKIKIKLSKSIIDFIGKMCKGRISTSTIVVDEVIQMYKEGNKRPEIFDVLVKRKYTPDYANFILKESAGKIKRSYEGDKSYLIGLHFKRYISIHDKHIGLAAGLVGFKNKYKRIDHYILAMDSLIAKEKLLGLHSKQYNIQLNNFINRERVESDNSGYGFEKLTTTELVELSELMAEAKVINHKENELNLFNEAMIKTGKITQDIIERIEEIDYEELESPLAKVHHEDEVGNKIIAQRRKSGNDIITIEEKIKDSNKSAFEAMLSKKIGKK